jgi:hypothetical protein
VDWFCVGQCTRQGNFGFCKILRISLLDEQLLVCKEGLCSMELFLQLLNHRIIESCPCLFVHYIHSLLTQGT